MRLLFLSNFYPPNDLGGMEQLCQEFAQGLRGLGHRVRILTSKSPKPLPRAADEDDVNRCLHLQSGLYYYNPTDFFLRRASWEQANTAALKNEIGVYRPEVVVVWGMWNLSYRLAYEAEILAHGKIGYYFADYWPTRSDFNEIYWQAPARRRVTEWMKKPLRQYALAQLKKEGYPYPLRFQHAACVSCYVRSVLAEAGKISTEAAVIHPGVDMLPFLQAAGRRQPATVLRLLYFGGLYVHKGVHLAIEAACLVRAARPDRPFELTILGGGHPDYVISLRNLVEQYGLGQIIQFQDRIPRNQVPAVLGSHDVFLFTTTSPEPLARTVLEAMAAGLAVVGSAVGGQTEMLVDGENSLIFPAGSAEELAAKILCLMDDPELRFRLADAGQAFVVDHFSIQRKLDEFEQWLLQINA